MFIGKWELKIRGLHCLKYTNEVGLNTWQDDVRLISNDCDENTALLMVTLFLLEQKSNFRRENIFSGLRYLVRMKMIL